MCAGTENRDSGEAVALDGRVHHMNGAPVHEDAAMASRNLMTTDAIVVNVAILHLPTRRRAAWPSSSVGVHEKGHGRGRGGESGQKRTKVVTTINTTPQGIPSR